VLVALLLSLVGAGWYFLTGPSGPPQDLRGPAPEVGASYRAETKVTMTKGTITMKADGQSVTGEWDLTDEAVEEIEIAAVADGKVIRTRTKVLTDKSRASVRIEGRTDTHDDSSPLQRETVESAKAGEEWKSTLVGKTPTEKQASKLKRFVPGGTMNLYPAEPVRPGHSWDVDIGELKKRMAGICQITSGSWKMRFEKTLMMNGELCAQIAEEIAIVGKTQDEHDEWKQIEMKLKGTTLRSLKQGLDLSSRFTGTMTMSGSLRGASGRRIQTTASGPVILDLKKQQNPKR
jgi:hypothetical protein